MDSFLRVEGPYFKFLPAIHFVEWPEGGVSQHHEGVVSQDHEGVVSRYHEGGAIQQSDNVSGVQLELPKNWLCAYFIPRASPRKLTLPIFEVKMYAPPRYFSLLASILWCQSSSTDWYLTLCESYCQQCLHWSLPNLSRKCDNCSYIDDKTINVITMYVWGVLTCTLLTSENGVSLVANMIITNRYSTEKKAAKNRLVDPSKILHFFALPLEVDEVTIVKI